MKKQLLAITLAAIGVSSCECGDPDIVVIPEPTDQIDLFTQKAAAQVDILWMIDNSGSMAAEQLKIADRFNQFFSQLITSQVDYHIAVVTSDPADRGILRAYNGPAVENCDSCRFLTNTVPCSNPGVVTTGLSPAEIESTLATNCPAQLVFRKMVNVGINGSSFEEGFTQVAAALGANVVDPNTGFPAGTVPPENVGFLRPEAALFVIFVSDEDEGAKRDGSPIRYYQRLFESLKGAGNENKVSVSAITGWPISADAPPLAQVCDALTTTFDNVPSNDSPLAPRIREIMTAANAGGCIDQGAAANDENAFAETGSRYVELACRTGGVVSNMCEADYSTALDQLGANAAGLLRKFTISRPDQIEAGPDCVLFTEDDNTVEELDCDGDGNIGGPFDDLLCVKAKPIGSTGDIALVPRSDIDGWTFDPSTSSIRFSGTFIPAPGSNVEIRYKIRPDTRVCAQ